jgi:hypothetical protein
MMKSNAKLIQMEEERVEYHQIQAEDYTSEFTGRLCDAFDSPQRADTYRRQSLPTMVRVPKQARTGGLIDTAPDMNLSGAIIREYRKSGAGSETMCLVHLVVELYRANVKSIMSRLDGVKTASDGSRAAIADALASKVDKEAQEKSVRALAVAVDIASKQRLAVSKSALHAMLSKSRDQGAPVQEEVKTLASVLMGRKPASAVDAAIVHRAACGIWPSPYFASNYGNPGKARKSTHESAKKLKVMAALGSPSATRDPTDRALLYGLASVAYFSACTFDKWSRNFVNRLRYNFNFAADLAETTEEITSSINSSSWSPATLAASIASIPVPDGLPTQLRSAYRNTVAGAATAFKVMSLEHEVVVRVGAEATAPEPTDFDISGISVLDLDELEYSAAEIGETQDQSRSQFVRDIQYILDCGVDPREALRQMRRGGDHHVRQLRVEADLELGDGEVAAISWSINPDDYTDLQGTDAEDIHHVADILRESEEGDYGLIE